ncbi:MAG: hypothetical protein EPN97_00740 [Alphaproteobacteria bacterium]|nr:MAG: hypothetical protein EPN97_00740 [Alphaproteobacteria bacterium]
MFDFKKKRLNPLLRQCVENINGALPVNTPDQAIGLLNLKQEITEKLGKLAQRQGLKAKLTFYGAVLLAVAGVAGAFLAPPVAIPAGVAAAAVFLGGSLLSQKYALNRSEVTQNRYVLSDKIDTEVAVAMTRFPALASSPDVKTALAQAFTESANKKDYESLSKRALQFTPVAPKPAAAQPA